ncbi:hypothetical protein LINGRAHAP2_LOCUS1801 [Linum grandiflorum]
MDSFPVLGLFLLRIALHQQVCLFRMRSVHEPKSGLSRTIAIEVEKLKLISKCCGSTKTIDKTISSLDMEVATTKVARESFLTGSPQSEDTKKGSTLKNKRKYLMVVGINTAFSSKKSRDSVRDTWMPQGSVSALFRFPFQVRLTAKRVKC